MNMRMAKIKAMTTTEISISSLSISLSHSDRQKRPQRPDRRPLQARHKYERGINTADSFGTRDATSAASLLV